jgi:hypothetical protein
MKTFKTITTQELTTLVCDSCGLKTNAESDYEFHEFISYMARYIFMTTEKLLKSMLITMRQKIISFNKLG